MLTAFDSPAQWAVPATTAQPRQSPMAPTARRTYVHKGLPIQHAGNAQANGSACKTEIPAAAALAASGANAWTEGVKLAEAECLGRHADTKWPQPSNTSFAR